jgi:hypothetical protein
MATRTLLALPLGLEAATVPTVIHRMHIIGYLVFHKHDGVLVHGFLSKRVAKIAINELSFALMAVS